VSAEDDMAALAEQLRSVAEQLSDLAMDQVRAAMHPDGDAAGGDGDPVHLERRLVRARRSVEKAAAILSQRPGQDLGDDGP
jgi:hypothetical protein